MAATPIDPHVALARGREILDPVLTQHGFEFVQASQPGTGDTASGAYVRGTRRLTFSFRAGALGNVVYHVGEHTLAHEGYMRLVLGPEGSNEYPGFAKDPLMGFHHLCHDLATYAGVFLTGSDERFAQLVRLAGAQAAAASVRPFLRA
ncbi:MAG TPA: hypothetical protein VJU87_05685 [Gemmatimonadaceae bacterium]|nr:hypothetical protein [Gemmatimonadaceae bacterium]